MANGLHMSNYRKILFTGGNGRFGKVFRKINKSKKYLYPSKKEFNIENLENIQKYLKKHKPDLLIHCAALSRPMDIHEKHISKSIKSNIIGTSNLTIVCSELKIKLIYFLVVSHAKHLVYLVSKEVLMTQEELYFLILLEF